MVSDLEPGEAHDEGSAGTNQRQQPAHQHVVADEVLELLQAKSTTASP